MTINIGGPGLGLPPAQAAYPSSLTNIAYNPASNTIALAPGTSIIIPAGRFMVDLGKYSILEFQDPTLNGSTISQASGLWRPIRTQRGTFQVTSDGVNFRVSNLLGCPVSATITTAGSGYVQASTTVTASAGGSTWQPVIGGRLVLTNIAIGAGYGVNPLVFIPAPSGLGLPATAYSSLSGSTGTVSSISLATVGAGYATAPVVTVLPNPFDPNLGVSAITAATITAQLTGSGTLSGLFCTNHGQPQSSVTLTIAGVGTQAAATANLLTTISNITVSAQGTGSYTSASISTIGGAAAADTYSNQDSFIPRPAQITAALSSSSGGLVIGGLTIIDGGMFEGTPTVVLNTYGGIVNTAPTVTITQGSVNDIVIIQPC